MKMIAELKPPPAETNTSLKTWVQLLRTYTKVQQRMSHVFRSHSLTSPQFDVLATLHHGEGLMQQELAARLLVTKGNICGVLDRLEAAQWIERRSDPDDRRTNRIYLTDSGRKTFAEVVPAHHAIVREIMGHLQAEETQTLHRLLKTLEAAADD